MRTILRNCFSRRLVSLQIAACCALATVATNASGQSILIPPPTVPEEPKTAETSSTTDTNQVESAGGAVSGTATGAGGLQNKNPFRWGPVILHPRVGYGYSYGNGLQSQPGQSSKSGIHTASAGMGLELGRHWDVSYSAGATFYSDSKFKDNVSHSLNLNGHTTYEDWSFKLLQSVALTSDPLVETAQQTDQQAYNTSLSVSYQIASDLSAQLTAGQSLTDIQGLTNSVGSTIDWTLSGNLSYQLGPGVSTGLGLGWGYNKVAQGPDTTYEDLSLQFSWQVARKISLSVNGGLQFRQFLGTGQPTLISPTYGVSCNYRPFTFTTLYVSANRGVSASFFESQVTENTTISLGLNQRLLKRFYFNLSGGYNLTDYQDSTPGGLAGISGRSDTRTFVSASLNTSFLKHGTATLSYSKSQNSSNTTGYGYTSDQAGISLSYGY